MDDASEEVFEEYRRIGGKIMGYLYFNILEPLYGEYPDLTPTELRRDDA